jgi:hypothetical protein
VPISLLEGKRPGRVSRTHTHADQTPALSLHRTNNIPQRERERYTEKLPSCVRASVNQAKDPLSRSPRCAPTQSRFNLALRSQTRARFDEILHLNVRPGNGKGIHTQKIIVRQWE